ncbi:MAG: glycosyltransferase [Myxococcota bacterium]
MSSALELCAFGSLVSWVYLTFLHARFWRADQRLPLAGDSPSDTAEWPAVAAVVPARNEARGVERALRSVLDQDYPGRLRVILVDDQSDDETWERALRVARSHPRGAQLEILRAPPRPGGWVGKMWAVHTGVSRAHETAPDALFLWITDADVDHTPSVVRRLVRKAQREQLDLASILVRLHCRSRWERLLVPAFAYFFQLLYPFARVNDPRSRVAGAAGGCMLVRATALDRAGGFEAIRGEIIDDCALGRLLKRGGRIWLGLCPEEYSFRPYTGLTEIWQMIARSAYTQLHHSPLLLAGTLVGLALLFGAPLISVLGLAWTHDLGAALAGGLAWALMTLTLQPTLRDYALSPALGAALPLAGLLYATMTLDSARRSWLGRGGEWKGRAGAGRADAPSGG